MNIIEEFKKRISNIDANSMLASITSTIGTLMTTDVVQFMWAIVAVSANVWTLVLSNRRSKIQLDKESADLDMRRLEVDEKKIQNEMLRKSLSDNKED